MNRLFQATKRSRRCVDDTLIYDNTIEQQFYLACDFLDRCAANGIILNPAKFQFAQKEVDFVGFTISNTRVRPTKSFLDFILSVPSPSSLTDIRSWHGMIAQVSYAFSKTEILRPIRHLLSRSPFVWSLELEVAFQASKKEIVKQCELGVRSFKSALPTCLAMDWSKFRIGYWLCQKRCSCPAPDQGAVPRCFNTEWQTFFVGSRFCTQAEQSYAPIEGEALAVSWAVNKCRYFLLCLPDFALALDYKPLISIIGYKSLDLIINPCIMNQRVKLLPFCFTLVHDAGKKNVTPDCTLRRTDSPMSPIDLLDPLPTATLAHMVHAQPTPEECQKAEDLEDLFANLHLPSVEALEAGGALTLSIAFLSAEDLEAGDWRSPHTYCHH